MHSYYTQYLLMGGINIEKSSRGCLKGAVAEPCCWKRHNWLHVGQSHALYEAVHRYICHDEYFTWKSIIYHKIRKIIKQTAQKFRRISSMGLWVTKNYSRTSSDYCVYGSLNNLNVDPLFTKWMLDSPNPPPLSHRKHCFRVLEINI